MLPWHFVTHLHTNWPKITLLFEVINKDVPGMYFYNTICFIFVGNINKLLDYIKDTTFVLITAEIDSMVMNDPNDFKIYCHVFALLGYV